MIFKRFKKLKRSSDEDFEKYKELMQEEKPSGKDFFAMILSAFLVIVLPCALILVGIALLALLAFGAL